MPSTSKKELAGQLMRNVRFDFGITENGVEYMFNLYRTHYTVISTLLKGQKGFERGQELENEIENFIKEEIKRINHDLFIKFGF